MNITNANSRVWKVALAVVAGVLFGALVYHAFLGEEARTYLWPAPWSLLWIGLIAVAGGFLSMALQRVPFAKRRPYILISEAVLAALCTVCFITLLCHSAILGCLVTLGCLGLILAGLQRTWKRVE